MTLPASDTDLADLAAQEARLVFDAFDHDTAWALGSRMVDAARTASLPVVVSIGMGGQRLFHAALPGTVPDNDHWVERKSAVVLRYGHSSLYVGTRARIEGMPFDERTDVDHARYAAHGGSFPITVRGSGAVGTVTVSGLPQLEDHAFLVRLLAAFLVD